MVVVTRAQANKQLEEEIVRREREVLSRAKPNLIGDDQQNGPVGSKQQSIIMYTSNIVVD